jgi:hypothetical protein
VPTSTACQISAPQQLKISERDQPISSRSPTLLPGSADRGSLKVSRPRLNMLAKKLFVFAGRFVGGQFPAGFHP